MNLLEVRKMRREKVNRTAAGIFPAIDWRVDLWEEADGSIELEFTRAKTSEPRGGWADFCRVSPSSKATILSSN
jgi:hypothetical protein